MRLLATLIVLAPIAVHAGSNEFPTFKVQEIDKTLKVGYALRIADLNKDGKLDVVVADSARVVWFDNAGDWKLHTIIDNVKAGVKPDNVCLDIHDIDGDGKLDIALGADWQPNNTTAGGSLQWLRQGSSIGEWTVHKIANSIPTLHRIHFVDIAPDDKLMLVVSPLKGANSSAAMNWSDTPVKLLGYPIPADPAGAWEPAVLSESLHVMHNVSAFQMGAQKALLTASYEGLGAVLPGTDGKWTWKHLGNGNQENLKGSRGSSEVKAGLLKGEPAYVATIEPMHGNQVVTYRFQSHRSDEPAPPDPSAAREVIDDQLQAGHALWCADLDGDGLDEIIAGFREPTPNGVGPGINLYRAASAEHPMTWTKHVLDEKAMATEDLACADLNEDGRIDIVAAGRATGNVRIYWNLGVAK